MPRMLRYGSRKVRTNGTTSAGGHSGGNGPTASTNTAAVGRRKQILARPSGRRRSVNASENGRHLYLLAMTAIVPEDHSTLFASSGDRYRLSVRPC
uniref:Uncharacterized protein n=1 Tax=Plectus sambesii TaxID=2011161 RepID=A0A914XQU4_9BILA